MIEPDMYNNENIFRKILNEQISEKRQVSLELSPENVDQLIRNPFGETSPLQLRTLEAGDYQKIPILNSVRYLAEMMEQQDGLKLTPKGSLQRKVIMDLYQRRFFPKTSDFEITDYKTVLNEGDLPTVSLTRILLELSGLARKCKGKLLLTRKWEKMKQDNDKLLRLIFETYIKQFNWAYFDGYRSEQAGQFGFAVSLALVDRFGDQPLSAEIYGGAYYSIFPWLQEDFVDLSFITAKKDSRRCYSRRTFERFLEYFGLVEVHRDKKDCLKPVDVEKTELFDKFIVFKL
ncbi:MAG: hypothetical protein PF904_17160 [Kiritimatiellae bacterium]|nr:hypothetical protein [Kiritimatiellia bacterium]